MYTTADLQALYYFCETILHHTSFLPYEVTRDEHIQEWADHICDQIDYTLGLPLGSQERFEKTGHIEYIEQPFLYRIMELYREKNGQERQHHNCCSLRE